jgi:hypothetical protein
MLLLVCEIIQQFWKTVWQFLKQLNIETLCGLSILYLTISKGTKNRGSPKNLHTKVHSKKVGNTLELVGIG